MSDTPNQPIAGPNSGTFGELSQQIGTQAALVAGFAVAGLTVISYDSSTPRFLVSAFGLACAATIALELVALCGSGKLSIMGKRHQFGERLYRHNMAAAYLNLGGLLAFVLAVNLLVWIKLGWVMRVFVHLIFLSMVVGAAIWNSTLERITNAQMKAEQNSNSGTTGKSDL